MKAELADWTTGQKQVVLIQCGKCATTWYLPRDRCPACLDSRSHRLRSAGNGICVAASTLYVTADDVDREPIRLCLVELDEGAVMMGRAQDGVHSGVRVRLGFEVVDERLLPSFGVRD